MAKYLGNGTIYLITLEFTQTKNLISAQLMVVARYSARPLIRKSISTRTENGPISHAVCANSISLKSRFSHIMGKCTHLLANVIILRFNKKIAAKVMTRQCRNSMMAPKSSLNKTINYYNLIQNKTSKVIELQSCQIQTKTL